MTDNAKKHREEPSPRRRTVGTPVTSSIPPTSPSLQGQIHMRADVDPCPRATQHRRETNNIKERHQAQ